MTEPRDDSLDRLLQQTLRDTDVGETPSCLDAEAMAAWMDGGLSGAALAAAEAHAATCARCRALVALIARSETVEQHPVEVPSVPTQTRGRRWLPWLVPLAAAALVALAIWIPRREQQPTRESTIALAPLAEPAPQAGAIGDRGQTPQPELPAAAAQETLSANAAKSRADEAELRREAAASAAIASAAAGQSSSLASTLSTAQTAPSTAPAPPVASPAPAAAAQAPAAATRAPAAPAPVTVAQEPGSSAASASPPRGFGLAASQTVIAEFESPRESTQAAAAGAVSARGGAGSASGVPAAAGTRAPAADGRGAGGGGGGRGAASGRGGLAGGAAPPNTPQPTRWRVLASGLVERSNPPGAVWETVVVDLAGLAVTAGAAPGPLVCWLVGRNGVVFLSNDDGRTFSRVMFPERVDLVAVRATSARAATVTTADGRAFATTDAGRSWSRE